MKKYLSFFILFYSFFYLSCLKEEFPLQDEGNNELVNKWIYDKMYNYYFWNDYIPKDIDYTKSPTAFFEGLLYKKGEEDRFSWIVEDANENYNHLHGNSKSFGFEYTLAYKNSERMQLYGIVLYVYPNSPAYPNVKRGDIFTSIDNQTINRENYISLLSKEKGIFLFRRNGKNFNIELFKTRIKENPIFYKNIYNIDQKKIGYLVYNSFIMDNGDNSKKYYNELLESFSYFKQNGINEFILDLRYNSGGLIDLSVVLASLIVPNVDSSKTAIQIAYNRKIMHDIYKDKNNSINFLYFQDSYIGNNIQKIYILTGNNTASASEAVINCLKPFMNVILIGNKTFGKNVGSITFTDKKKRFLWAIQPIILKIYNSKGESNYSMGFTPDIPLNEFLFPMKELGDTEEPLLNKAISLIKGDILPTSNINSRLIYQYNSSLDRFSNTPIIVIDSTLDNP